MKLFFPEQVRRSGSESAVHLDLYHFRGLESNTQASLKYGENRVKNDKFMKSFETSRNDPG